MKAPQGKDTVSATPAPKQDDQASSDTAREGAAVELSGDTVEERIMPRLATNHNETFLAD